MDNQLCPPEDHIWSLLSKKFTNEASSEELEELNTLLLKNSELQHRADMLMQMWQQPTATNLAESEAAYMRHLMNHKDEFFLEENNETDGHNENEVDENRNFFKRNFYGKTLLAFLVFILIAGVSSYFLFKSKKINQTTEAISSVVTKNGNRTKIILPDGSQVWLNAGSKLDYNNLLFNKDLREVSLNGEAYFDVTKNANKPFIIHTRKMDIKVLGTAFNIRSYSDEQVAEASLIRGSIEVTLKDRKDQKIILKPNEKISIASDEKPKEEKNIKKPLVINSVSSIPQIVVKELQPNPVSNIIGEIAWTQNKLYFEDERLDKVALIIERWFGKPVIIQNEALKKLRYTGNFENESLEEILSYLKLSAPFNFRMENDKIIIF